ncbi:metal-dependent hydrolase [Paenibacillus sp. FJAT-26967]|uniref:metal-dependent hydrolase n=1 Tax=Paenibacillus sp. FJAT-26967 TaxID=1729690 RepID=UPI000839AC63|nr:metal-dependent hydrolase [Paenibacillus sp. FJAT-26967]
MDTVTHALFGLTLYGAIDKSKMSQWDKRALLFTTVIGSEIPDIDVISQAWDTTGRYQMWHRGITHSVFLIPVWAAMLVIFTKLFWGRASLKLFGVGALAVFIHSTSDLFNAWGTGYLEPVSSTRITFGTIPIVSVTFWLIMLAGLLTARHSRGKWAPHRIFKVVWLLIALHVGIQSVQGYMLYQQAQTKYEQVALSADFVPGVFTIIGKTGDQVELTKGSTWAGQRTVASLKSSENADLGELFTGNPKAKTLQEWSPFVVVVDDGKKLGIYDPRFYRDGQSFLFESIERSAAK